MYYLGVVMSVVAAHLGLHAVSDLLLARPSTAASKLESPTQVFHPHVQSILACNPSDPQSLERSPKSLQCDLGAKKNSEQSPGSHAATKRSSFVWNIAGIPPIPCLQNSRCPIIAKVPSPSLSALTRARPRSF